MFRRSSKSSNINIFTQNKHDYVMILKNSSYKAKSVHKNMNEKLNVHNKTNNRTRKMLWFRPPYNIAMVNKLEKEFFRILKKNFPQESNLYKIFNKNHVELSNSCMPTVANLINKSYTKKLRIKQHVASPKCNCINKATCPLKGKC